MVSIQKRLIGGSIILLIGFNIFNALNFIFNLSMTRLLTLAEYGVLTTLINIIIIFVVFSESVQTVISRYTAKIKFKTNLKSLLKKTFYKAGKISFILFLFYMLLGLFLSSFLNIKYSLILLTGVMLISAFFTAATRGILQGRKQFSSLGINMALEGTIKLVVGISLVIIGAGVFGAVFGIIIGAGVAFLFSLISIKDVLNSKEEKVKTPEIYNYTKPVFITVLAVMLFLSFDIILARRFFSPDLVGAYAIASTLAKIIFIGTHPISKAMFPISAETKRKKDSEKILMSSLKILGVLILIPLIIIFFFSDSIIWIYSGKHIVEAASILFYLAIAASLLSLTNLILLYNLSLGKPKFSLALLTFVVIQAILLSLFHDTLLEFSLALVVSSAIFLWGSIILLDVKNT